MARPRPEQYQLSLDFTARPEPRPDAYPVLAGPLLGVDAREVTLSRFVRPIRERVQAITAQDVADYLMHEVFTPFAAFDQEELWVLLLNTKNYLTHDTMVYRGMVNSVHIRPAEVFKEAVRFNAPSLILAHCHPSGDPTPSPEDATMTEMLVQAGKLLDIEVLDHLVIGDPTWKSLRAMGLGFAPPTPAK
jgi:DNA repair protein RadC